MSALVVHRHIHGHPGATVREVAQAVGLSPQRVRDRIRTLLGRGDVDCLGCGAYRSARPPESVDNGLTEHLALRLRSGRYGARFSRIAGFSPQLVVRAMGGEALDAPSATRELNRAVCAETARRLAEALEADASALREWAERCERAMRGEA